MKRFLVIGLGNFGSTVAQALHRHGHEVVALDTDEELVDELGTRVSRAMVGDGTNRALLKEVGAEEVDAAVISTGSDLSASVLALLALRDLGVREIFVKVMSDDHARIVETLGATDSIFPERESAVGLASRLTSGKLLQYVQLGGDLGLQEMPMPTEWLGSTLRALGLPQRYRVQVVALHDVLRDQMLAVPDPDRVLTESDTLLVAGHPEALEKVAAVR